MMRRHRYFKDFLGYILEKSRPRAKDPDDGRGDSVGNTVLAAIIYRDQKLIDVIVNNFIHFLTSFHWEPIRHPEDPRTEDFSRDHTVYFVMWLRYFQKDYLPLALKIPYRISEKFTQRDVFLWIRAVARGSWWDKFIYWAIISIVLRVNRRWNDWLLCRAKITSEDYRSFKATSGDQLNKKELYARKNMISAYSIHIQAWMIKCLDDGWFKDRLKKRIVPLVEKTNWFVRMLADDEFDWWEIDSINDYTGMDAWRWGRRLDKTTDIDLFLLEGPQPEYNMDVDVLKANLDWE